MLLVCFIFQLTLFTTLETMSRDEGAIVVWQWQQFCCMTLVLQGFMQLHGRRTRRLWAHKRGLHQPGFFDKTLLGYLMRGSSRDVCVWTSRLLSICVVLSHHCYREKIRTCSWPFQFKSRLALAGSRAILRLTEGRRYLPPYERL